MKHLFSILTAVFAVLVFFVSCGGSEGGDGKEESKVYGYVTDYDTGEPIGNVHIEFGGEQIQTGLDGYFEFVFMLKKGSYAEYWVTFSKAGYIEKSHSATVRPGDMLRFDEQLEKDPNYNNNDYNNGDNNDRVEEPGEEPAEPTEPVNGGY